MSEDILAGLLAMLLMALLYLGGVAAVVFVIVKVLQFTGVL